MPSLSSAKLSITLGSGSQNADVTATVTVSLTEFDKQLVKLGLKFKLKCKLRGADSGLNGADDDLFQFPTKTVTAAGTFTFKATVSRDTLDEDWEGNDEIYARFTLQSAEAILPFVTSKNSPEISGNF